MTCVLYLLFPPLFSSPCSHHYLIPSRPILQIRIGNILDVDGRLMQVLKQAHAQGTGRQLGNVQLELRDILTKSKHPLRLRPSDMVDVVRLDEKKFQFLYQEDDVLHCMDPDTFEQVAVGKDLLERTAFGFLAEGGDVILSFHDGSAVGGALPPTVVLKVAEASPHLKGEAQAPQYKPAVLETGVTISVPPFVVAGDAVVVDTTEGKFMKRAS
jgi:elongation factor P